MSWVAYATHLADIPIVFVHLFNISVDDLEGNELVIGRGASGNEEERGITTVDYLRIWPGVSQWQTLNASWE